MIRDQPFRTDDPDATFDVYFPTSTASDATLPSIVWTHGGAWLSGDKSNTTGYFALLASRGYTVVAVNYSLAPGSRYPKPVHQLNDALGYLIQEPQRFHIDPAGLVLAGDSAGAQITSQIACLMSNPAYAESIGVRPALSVEQIRGLILHCGFYDMRILIDRGRTAPSPLLRWGIKTMVWAYTGKRANDSPPIREMSTIDHVTSRFPPTFLSGGNGDPLTDAHSRPMAKRLHNLGVPVVTLFYNADHRPRLPHEYQFTLDHADGRKAFDTMVTFLEQSVSAP